MRLKKIVSLTWIVALVVSFWGCGSDKKTEIRLYAGAGMRRAVDELIVQFKQQSGIDVVADYGGSGLIISRAKEDAGTDLFMPGDVAYVDRLQELTGAIESKTPVSYFVPVIIVKKGNPKKITGLSDFARKDLKVALGKPKACQIGKLSHKLFVAQGIDSTAIAAQESLTVNELGVWVKMNTVDASIVWDAIAENIAGEIDCIPIPEEQNMISRVVVGLMKNAPNKTKAQKFIDFIKSPEGQTVLKDKGYRVKL